MVLRKRRVGFIYLCRLHRQWSNGACIAGHATGIRLIVRLGRRRHRHHGSKRLRGRERGILRERRVRLPAVVSNVAARPVLGQELAVHEVMVVVRG